MFIFISKNQGWKNSLAIVTVWSLFDEKAPIVIIVEALHH